MAVEQHIITDKTLIRTAKVISVMFTPFSIPFMAFLILFVFSYLRIMPLQYKLIVLGVVYCFYNPYAYSYHLPLSQNQRVQSRRPDGAETKIHTFHSDHYLLCILPAHDAPVEYSLVHDGNYPCRPHHDDYLRDCQFEMETQRTHGRRRRHNRRPGCFQRPIRV